MTVDEILDALGATTPEDLLRRYQTGHRDFTRVNLLRAELKSAVEPGLPPDCAGDSSADRQNPPLAVVWPETKHGAKSDALDAHGLAERLRIGRLGRVVFKAPRHQRALRVVGL